MKSQNRFYFSLKYSTLKRTKQVVLYYNKTYCRLPSLRLSILCWWFMTVSQLVNIRFVELVFLLDLNSILWGMLGTPDHHCINGSHIVLAGHQSFMCKNFCVLPRSSTQISPQQRCKNLQIIFYLLFFDVQFFNLEIKIEKCIFWPIWG